ncbi:MAG: 30S ribosomal protein S1 [Fibrobacter sp.]|jgi:small subunit ribosomal protein S1|nr:30S ribosomal protein S1 [Fibrobacter sp.]
MNSEKSHIIIAVDGFSGTGKSTTARLLSQKLGIVYLDTGAMYRAITSVAIEAGVAASDISGLKNLLEHTKIDFDENNQVLINGVLSEKKIRSIEVSEQVSFYSAVPVVREILTQKQREFGAKTSCVLDGRDIGTTVFPNANFKFFLVTDIKVRAARRFAELQAAHQEGSLEEIEENLRQRDELDSSRAVAPLQKALDAIEIDTTHLSIQEQVQQIQAIVGVVAKSDFVSHNQKNNNMSKIRFGTQEDLDEILAAEAELGSIGQGEDTHLYADMGCLEPQTVTTGKISQVNDQEVLVDVNFKSEGVIDREEFKESDNLEIGTEIEVFVETLEGEDGRLVLSKQKADFVRVWDEIHKAFENNEIVRGTLTKRIKGGVVVDLFGIDAFLPGSQIDLRQIPDINALIGESFDLKVIKVNKARRNIVVSRRVVLEEERNRQRGDILETLEKDQVRKGVVKNITDFGAFIDLGGVDGLLHITDMSYKRINHPNEMLQLGDELEVIVLDFNDKKERISLGVKQLKPHPWKDVAERYPEGMPVKGKVVSITDYGAFIELDSGIEGLIHVSEMSWTQHVKHPSKILEVGQEVEAVVLKVEEDVERISLGMKQLETDPWETIESELPPGARVVGEIRNLASFGAFVEIKEGVDGLIHVSDMSWTQKITHPNEIVKKGDKVECVVLAVDCDKRRISLSMKHLTEDPWDTVEESYPMDSEVKGKIIRMLDRGVVVELPDGIEGFVPVSKLTAEFIKVPSEAFKVGDEVPAVVSEIDVENRKLLLSVVDYFKNKETAELEAWMESHKPGENKTSIGDAVAPAKKKASKKKKAAEGAESENAEESAESEEASSNETEAAE